MLLVSSNLLSAHGHQVTCSAGVVATPSESCVIPAGPGMTQVCTHVSCSLDVECFLLLPLADLHGLQPIALVSCLPDESSAGSLPLVSVSLFTPLTAAEMAPYMKRLSRGQTVEGESGNQGPAGSPSRASGKAG